MDHEALDQFLPDPSEIAEIKQVQQFIFEKLKNRMTHWAIDGDVIFTGSTALGTFLRGDPDIDLFVVVDVETIEEFKQVFYRFANLEWLQGQYIKHGHEPDREAMVRRLAIWSGTVKLAQTKGYCLDLIVLPRVGGSENHTRFETLSHVEFFRRNLTTEQKRDVVRLKALFKLGGLYGADQWGIKGVDCQTLIYKYKTLEGALSFLSTLTPRSQLLDPSYQAVRIERDLFATIFQSPLAKIRVTQIREIATNYLGKRELPRPFEKEEWVDQQTETQHVVFSLLMQGPDQAETFTKAVSAITHALKQIRGTVEELRDLQAEIDARILGQTILISLKFHDLTPTIQRSLDKSKLDKRQRVHSIKIFKRNSRQRAHPPLITGIQIVEDSETVTIVFRRNPVFARFLVLKFVQTILERKGFELESWDDPFPYFKSIQKYFKIDPRVEENVILNDLENYSRIGLEDKNKVFEHTLEVYYTLAAYLWLPNLLGINENAVKKFQKHFSKKYDGIPKRILIQIATLYHNLGKRSPPFEVKKKPPFYRHTLIGESIFRETIGPKIGLTPEQINYVANLLDAYSRLNLDLDAGLGRERKALGEDFPDLVLLVYADKVALNQTTLLANKHLAGILEHFFESCEVPDPHPDA